MDQNIKTQVKEVLNHTDHRQYALPEKQWLLYQEWHNVLLLHWSVDPDLIRGLIPEPLQLDLINETAYISIIGFTVKNFQTALTPLPFVSSFDEVNVRTYVTYNGIKGIYFFSLHADKFSAVWGAKLLYQLPYLKATINLSDSILYAKNEYSQKLNICLNHSTFSPIQKDILDVWLTERHAFYQSVGGNLYRCDIHHKEWPLHKMVIYSGQIRAQLGEKNEEIIIDGHPNKVHYAPQLKVLFWNRIKVPNRHHSNIIFTIGKKYHLQNKLNKPL